MNEPDRPRRDVSVEEAERMAMTDEELDAIEARSADAARTYPSGSTNVHGNVLALVAEVRRLRGEFDHIADHLDGSAERANQGRDARSFGLRSAAAIVRDMREGV